jgi:hypothetical protein
VSETQPTENVVVACIVIVPGVELLTTIAHCPLLSVTPREAPIHGGVVPPVLVGRF